MAKQNELSQNEIGFMEASYNADTPTAKAIADGMGLTAKDKDTLKAVAKSLIGRGYIKQSGNEFPLTNKGLDAYAALTEEEEDTTPVKKAPKKVGAKAAPATVPAKSVTKAAPKKAPKNEGRLYLVVTLDEDGEEQNIHAGTDFEEAEQEYITATEEEEYARLESYAWDGTEDKDGNPVLEEDEEAQVHAEFPGDDADADEPEEDEDMDFDADDEDEPEEEPAPKAQPKKVAPAKEAPAPKEVAKAAPAKSAPAKAAPVPASTTGMTLQEWKTSTANLALDSLEAEDYDAALVYIYALRDLKTQGK